MGLTPEADALIKGIAAKVSCLDREFETIREKLDAARLASERQTAAFVGYKEAVEKQTAILLEEFQKHFARKDSPNLKV